MKYKTFFRIDIPISSHVLYLKNSKLCENTPLCGRPVCTQFLVFPISTGVDITVCQHANVVNFFSELDILDADIGILKNFRKKLH